MGLTDEDNRCLNCGGFLDDSNLPWMCGDCFQDGFASESDPFDGELWEKIDDDE